MSKPNRNYIDDMVDIFGYDYVIGYCLCSEYETSNRAKKTEDEDKKAKLLDVSKRYGAKADQLTRERMKNGL